MSAREKYPQFIPLHENILLQASWALRGLYDSFRINVLISTIINDAEIRSNLLKSILLNSLSLISIYTFDLILHPLVKDQEKWLHRNLGRFYQILWLLPIVGASFYLNLSWCTAIAKRTYILQYGSRAIVQPPRNYSNFLNQLATSAYRVVMVFTSVVVSYALKEIPYIGAGLEFAFLCWVDSYYFFESVWIYRGYSFSGRIRHLEERWAYYLTFGLPSAIIYMAGTGLAGFALFALIFPIYIILATHAKPAPKNPYNPSSISEGDVIRHPSPFIPIRIPVFAPVVFLNNFVARILDVIIPPTPNANHPSRNRAISIGDASESVEEGNGSKVAMQKGYSAPQPVKTTRVNIGMRRKRD